MEAAFKHGHEDMDEDGLEEAFTFIEQFNEVVASGCWISNDCFTFSNSKGQINYLIGSKILKLTNADKRYFILGYSSS